MIKELLQKLFVFFPQKLFIHMVVIDIMIIKKEISSFTIVKEREKAREYCLKWVIHSAVHVCPSECDGTHRRYNLSIVQTLVSQ